MNIKIYQNNAVIFSSLGAIDIDLGLDSVDDYSNRIEELDLAEDAFYCELSGHGINGKELREAIDRLVDAFDSRINWN